MLVAGRPLEEGLLCHGSAKLPDETSILHRAAAAVGDKLCLVDALVVLDAEIACIQDILHNADKELVFRFTHPWQLWC